MAPVPSRNGGALAGGLRWLCARCYIILYADIERWARLQQTWSPIKSAADFSASCLWADSKTGTCRESDFISMLGTHALPVGWVSRFPAWYAQFLFTLTCS